MAAEPLRVTHVVPALFDREDGVLGGAERYAYELARHMADRVHTELVTFGGRDREERDGRLRIRVLGRPWHVRGQRHNPISLSLLGELRRASVVHCHQRQVVASTTAALYCRLTGRRVFVSDLGGGGFDLSAFISTDRWYHGHLHISEYSRDLCGHRTAPWAHVILGGVDTKKFSPGEGVERTGTVLFVGRLLPHKGVNYLVEAVRDDQPLLVIGRPDDSRFYRDLQALAHGKTVQFRHDCDDTDLVEAYRRASCIVLPSVYRTVYGERTAVPELLGQALLEGMACGAPAICTDVASMPEIVEDGRSGFVVPPNDVAALRAKLEILHANPTQARAMGQAARHRVSTTFTWDAVVQRCLDIYTAPAGSRRDGENSSR